MGQTWCSKISVWPFVKDYSDKDHNIHGLDHYRLNIIMSLKLFSFILFLYLSLLIFSSYFLCTRAREKKKKKKRKIQWMCECLCMCHLVKLSPPNRAPRAGEFAQIDLIWHKLLHLTCTHQAYTTSHTYTSYSVRLKSGFSHKNLIPENTKASLLCKL